MLAGIRTFISNYTNGMYFPHIQIIDIIEILIITVIVYEIMLWIKPMFLDARRIFIPYRSDSQSLQYISPFARSSV